MATIYKQRGIWYLDLCLNYKRTRRSLHTSCKKEALKLLKHYKSVPELNVTDTKISFSQLVDLYLSAEHNWTEQSRDMTERALKRYLEIGLPININSQAIFKNRVNMCINWGKRNGFITEQLPYPGKETKSKPRTRVFSKNELQIILNDFIPLRFRLFVQFAYYTGARQGEIKNMDPLQIYEDRVEVDGKSGIRLIKLNKQAQCVLHTAGKLWNYRRDYISSVFKRNTRMNGIHNARFHDLRRTFGYNLISRGMPIYQVSKLLGHSSVTTTERYYAPLLAIDIEDFVL